MKSLMGTLAAAASLLVLASSAHAATVYDNGGPNGASGNDLTEWVQAEDFTLSANTSLTGATAYLFSFGAAIDGTPLTYDIFANSGGSPGSLLASGSAGGVTVTNTGLFYSANPIYAVAFNFASAFNAAAGTTYWLGVHATDSFSRTDIYSATTASNGTSTGHESNGGTFNNWFDNGQEHAFSLQGGAGAVPEPATWAMMIIGFGLAGVAMRRRRAATLAA